MEDKVRVHEIAKELGIASKEVVDKAATIGVSVKTASSTVSMAEAEKIMNFIMSGAAPEPAKKKVVVKKAAPKAEPTETVAKEEVPEKTPTTEVPIAETVVAPVVEEKITKPEAVKTPEAPSTQTSEEAKEVKAPVEEKVAEKSKKRPSLIKEVKPVLVKRSGLKIVKKRKPKVEETFAALERGSEASRVSNYGKMSADVLEELASKKSVPFLNNI